MIKLLIMVSLLLSCSKEKEELPPPLETYYFEINCHFDNHIYTWNVLKGRGYVDDRNYVVKDMNANTKYYFPIEKCLVEETLNK